CYSPEVPEHRTSLAGDSFPIVRSTMPFVAIDRSIWAQRDIGLARWGGEDWTDIAAAAGELMTPATSGEEGVVLFGGTDQHSLFQRSKFLAKGHIRKLVRDHRELLAKAFASPRSSQYVHEQIPGFGI